MKEWLARRTARVVLIAAAVGLVAGGVAYATIPDGSGVYTGCMLKLTGRSRWIAGS